MSNDQHNAHGHPPTHVNGIPVGLTVEFLAEWVRPRVSAKRFRHIEGVVTVAKKLATRAECEVHHAEIAAWLHDACKQVNDEELVRMAKEYGLVLSDLEAHNGHLLHGPVAAALSMHELDLTNEDILDAISEHTLGAVPMSTLSKIVFLADALEESRPENFRKPIWDSLDFNGTFDLDNAVVVTTQLCIAKLIEKGKPVHPRAEEVIEYYGSLK